LKEERMKREAKEAAKKRIRAKMEMERKKRERE
jgi:hypothetical protein